MKREVSLYIPCYNCGEIISYCIKGVLSQTYHIDEILVIDDGSTDNSINIVKQFPVKIISHNKNRGLAAARNTALKVARNEFIASLDADCVPEKNWLESLMKNFTDDKIAGVSGRLLERFSMSLADKWRKIHMSQNYGEEFLINPPFLHGNNTVFRKSILLSIGGYDEKFRTNGEDSDLSQRLKSAGYKLLYDPKALVWHFKTDTILSVLKTRWKYDTFDTKKSNFKDLYYQIRVSFSRAKEHFLKDLKERNYSLIGIDILEGFFCSYFSLKHYMKSCLRKSC